jgi:hypothetical protein
MGQLARFRDQGVKWLKQKFRWLVVLIRTTRLTEALKKGKADMDMIMGVIRALLAALGGWVANKGWASQEEVTTIVGALITLIVGIWSIVAKARSKPVDLKAAE